jgi:hypothetical protein
MAGCSLPTYLGIVCGHVKCNITLDDAIAEIDAEVDRELAILYLIYPEIQDRFWP